MEIALKKFLKIIESEERPDLKDVAGWLKELNMDEGTWKIVSKELCKNYGFKDEAALRRSMQGSESLTTKPDDYVDDFSPLLDDIKLGGWIRDYVEHTRGMEPPTVFHFATALTILGASLRRNVHIDFGYFQIWPAIQSMLVGPSGKTKKTTASEYGVDLACDIKEKRLFNLLPDEGSGEALKTELYQIGKREKASTGLLFVSEMATFIGKQEYNTNLVQTLTDLFDSRKAKRRRTGARGSEDMVDIAVSALLCSNEDWLADAIPASAFGGGFFGRMLVFYQPDTDRIFPQPEMDFRERVKVQTHLKLAAQVQGKCILTPDASRWYDGRYRQMKKQWPKDERIVPFWERLHIHLLRMAMLITISDNLGQDMGGEIIHLEVPALEKADSILGWVLKYLPKVYVHVGGTQFGADHHRIHSIISRHGGFLESEDLGRKMSSRLSRRQLREHTETMEANGVITKVRINPWEGRYGWRVIKKLEE